MLHFKKIDWSISLFVLFACVLTVIAACVESSGPLGAPNFIEVPTVSSVQITLAQSALAPGQTTQATVVAKSADGEVVAGRVDFSSQNPSIATVSSNGVVTALTAGVAMIQATVAARVATASLTVQSLASPVAVVAVALDSTSLAIGHAAKATAVAKDAAGSVITGQAVTWASLSPTIATVSSMGAVMAVAPGSATIKGTISGKSGSASLTVVQVSASPVITVAVAIDSTTLGIGHSAQASATPRDAAGNTIVGQTVTWASLTPSLATVSSSGVVTAVAAGSVAIQATVSGVVGSTSIVVVAPTDLASHDFNDGTFGLYTNPSPLDIDVVADPTGAGKGKVARLHYVRATSDGSYVDVNRAFQFKYPRRYGDPLYFRGDFYIPTADLGDGFVGRKLIYWQSHVDYGKYPGGYGGVNLRTVVGLAGNGMYVDATFNPQPGFGTTSDTYRTRANGIATVTANTWYTLEVFQQLESSIGAKDGTLRIWLNGTMIWEKTTMQWTDPNWLTGNIPGNSVPVDAADIYFERFYVGDQFNWTGIWDEYRYWDNVTFSTEHMGY